MTNCRHAISAPSSYPEIFPLECPSQEESKEPMHWSIGCSSYTISISTLDSIDLHVLVPHCIKFMEKIKRVVTNQQHQGHAMFMNFSRTLSTSLVLTWDSVIFNFGGHLPALNNCTVAHFEVMLHHFIAAHSTGEDRSNLISQLHNMRKPRNMRVRQLWYLMRELNSYVEWLPGNETPLNEDELRQAFYNAMPTVWCDRLIASGQSSNNSMTQLVHFFCCQENNAFRSERDNTARQKREAKQRRCNGSTKEMPCRAVPTKGKFKCIKSKDLCSTYLCHKHNWDSHALGDNLDKGKPIPSCKKKCLTSDKLKTDAQTSVNDGNNVLLLEEQVANLQIRLRTVEAMMKEKDIEIKHLDDLNDELQAELNKFRGYDSFRV